LELAPWLPWFLRATHTFAYGDFTNTVTESTALLPSDHLRDQEDTRLWYTSTDPSVDAFVTLSKLTDGMLITSTPRTQQFYEMDNLSIKVRLPVVNTQTYYLKYYAQQTGNMLDDAIEASNSWFLMPRIMSWLTRARRLLGSTL
jgi:hypothetical protein